MFEAADISKTILANVVDIFAIQNNARDETTLILLHASGPITLKYAATNERDADRARLIRFQKVTGYLLNINATLFQISELISCEEVVDSVLLGFVGSVKEAFELKAANSDEASGIL